MLPIMNSGIQTPSNLMEVAHDWSFASANANWIS